QAGVRIIEYTHTELHAKVAVVDDKWATVGSSNYDGLSLFVNQEANVVVQDPAFAAYLRQEIEAGAAGGRVVHLSDFLH
ncbi:phospholipase D-like domain-containing protein, partial [Acinetobacter baumannii]